MGNADRRLSWMATVGVVLGVVVALVAIWFFWDREAVQAWKAQAGPVPFFAAMAILPAIGVPMTPFFIAAGATFGVPIGLVGSLVALAVNLVGSYAIAHSGLRPHVERLVRRLGYELPRIDTRKDALRSALVVKLAPGLPTFAKSYLVAVANVPFVIYFVVSMLISGVYGAALVVLGESVFEHDLRRIWPLAVPAVIVLAGVGIFKRRRRRASAAAGA